MPVGADMSEKAHPLVCLSVWLLAAAVCWVPIIAVLRWCWGVYA